RAVALGDSFTQGFGVQEQQAWPRRLETLLDARRPGRYEVVNLGVPGTNPRDHLDHLESLGFAWDDRTLTDTTFTDRLRALARSEDVAFVDLLPVLRARRNEGLYFPRDGHWSPAGHQLVARVVARTLEAAEGDDDVPRTDTAGRLPEGEPTAG